MSKAAISIEGFIATELEVRTAGTHRVVDVKVAHTPSKQVDGTWVNEDDKTTWFSATFWDEHADAVMGSVQKGSLVAITGSLELDVYLKNDGKPGGKVKVTNPTIAAVVRKPKRGHSAQPSAPERWATAPDAPTGDVWNQPSNYNGEEPF